jgi:hypothetical protein
MTHDVYVFGDSHWRVFFPFVNHGAAADNVSYVEHNIRTIDTIANELSGSTMYGLLNPNSRHGARNRILNTLDSLGGVDNVGLVFGEVDARYHNGRYFKDGAMLHGKVLELISRYMRFVEEDLILSGRVRGNVFIYHGFRYPQGVNTLLQPGQPIGPNVRQATDLNIRVNDGVRAMCSLLGNVYGRVHWVGQSHVNDDDVSTDGVHLIPEKIQPAIFRRMREVFDGQVISS